MVIDPIADMLTRIRNATMAGHSIVAMPYSKLKVQIAKILQDDGFLAGFEVVKSEAPSNKILRLRIMDSASRKPGIKKVEHLNRFNKVYKEQRRWHSPKSSIKREVLSPTKPSVIGKKKIERAVKSTSNVTLKIQLQEFLPSVSGKNRTERAVRSASEDAGKTTLQEFSQIK